VSAEESKRVTAAREAVADAMVKYGPDGHIDGYEEITDAALGASDAVMFSPDAIERAARALRATGLHPGILWCPSRSSY